MTKEQLLKKYRKEIAIFDEAIKMCEGIPQVETLKTVRDTISSFIDDLEKLVLSDVIKCSGNACEGLLIDFVSKYNCTCIDKHEIDIQQLQKYLKSINSL